MSHYVLVRPDREDFEQNYPKVSSKESMVEELKEEIIVKVMNNEYDTYRNIKFVISLLAATIEQEKKGELRESFEMDEKDWAKKGELLFCGSWLRNLDYDNDGTEKYVTEDLWIKTKCVPKYDYYDEAEKWSTKFNDVKETLDYFIDTMNENIIKELIVKYGNALENDEEEDLKLEKTELC